MNVNLDLLRTSPTTALTKSYLAEAALQLLHEQDAAIAAAVAEAVAKETERCIMALENIDILGVNQRERSISEHTINSGAAAIRNGSAASKVTRNSAGEHQIRKDKQS